MSEFSCPNCNHGSLEDFYHVSKVPVHNVLLMHSEKEAREFPRGDIRLAFCSNCGFISNRDFDDSRTSYNEDYEESQAASTVFREFHQHLAEELVTRYGLKGKTVLEIGCGKGEFLEQLCLAGCGHGIGYDPVFTEGRISVEMAERITVYTKNYSQVSTDIQADLICCKMTLEHIPATREFIRELSSTLKNMYRTPVFFMLPDAGRILTEGAFWDIYYEHCSYFTEASLRYLFLDCGFTIKRLERRFENQYLSIEAELNDTTMQPERMAVDCRQFAAEAKQFSDDVSRQRRSWQEFLHNLKSDNKRVVLWGGGSKAVAFISTMKIASEIDFIIDIQPRKQGCFLPGSGHAVVGPDELRHAPADVIILMNPVYWDEVSKEMQRQGCTAQLLSILKKPGPGGILEPVL